jgi:hypothetical protein
MRSFSIGMIALLALMACAEAQLTQTGAGKVAGGGGPPSSNFILMVDNTSRILQTDNVSKICLAGGC